jgi:hypothetical protein
MSGVNLSGGSIKMEDNHTSAIRIVRYVTAHSCSRSSYQPREFPVFDRFLVRSERQGPGGRFAGRIKGETREDSNAFLMTGVQAADQVGDKASQNLLKSGR